MCENDDVIVIPSSISNLGSSGHQSNRDILNYRSTTHTGDTHSYRIISNAMLYGSIPSHISDSEAVVHSREMSPRMLHIGCTPVLHDTHKPEWEPPSSMFKWQHSQCQGFINLVVKCEGLRFKFREYTETQASKQSRSSKNSNNNSLWMTLSVPTTETPLPACPLTFFSHPIMLPSSAHLLKPLSLLVPNSLPRKSTFGEPQ